MTKDEAMAWAECEWYPPRDECLREAFNKERKVTRVLAASVRELDGRSCDTCDNQRVELANPKNPWCSYLTTLARGKTITCYDVDQGCNAWKGKGQKQNVSQ